MRSLHSTKLRDYRDIESNTISLKGLDNKQKSLSEQQFNLFPRKRRRRRRREDVRKEKMKKGEPQPCTKVHSRQFVISQSSTSCIPRKRMIIFFSFFYSHNAGAEITTNFVCSTARDAISILYIAMAIIYNATIIVQLFKRANEIYNSV